MDRRPWLAIAEMAAYALGAGALFYFMDILLMRWQGLALH
jgi:hypothetical protein